VEAAKRGRSKGKTRDGGRGRVGRLMCASQRTILSMPRGPRLVRMASATALAASMFIIRTSRFLEDALSLQRDAGGSSGLTLLQAATTSAAVWRRRRQERHHAVWPPQGGTNRCQARCSSRRHAARPPSSGR
jgi:LSD1 subclass zinc finger protein